MKWRWMSNDALVIDEGRRPVVLSSGRHRDGTPYLATCGPNGLLIQFDPKSEAGRLIASAPEMAERIKKLEEENKELTRLLGIARAGLRDLREGIEATL